MKSNINVRNLVVILLIVMVVSFGIGGSMISTYRKQNVLNSQRGWNLFGLNEFGITTNRGNLEKHIIDEEKTYPIESVKKIEIRTSSPSVNVFRSDGEEIRVHFHGSVETNTGNIPYMHSEDSGNKLSIESRRPSGSFSGTHRENVKFDIYLPETHLEEIEITSSSGSVSINEMLVQKMSIRTSSGSIKIDQALTEMTTLRASSGSISLSNFEGQLQAETSSGSIRVDSGKTTKTYVRASSGSVSLINFSGELQGETSSGSIKVEYEEFNDNVNLRATSGRIQLKLPKDASFRIYAESRSSSSKIDSQFPILMTSSSNRVIEGIVGDGTNQVNLQTSSGSINIYH
ncbi:DUF4097 family beta strand repeat-containing protein [Alkaliphilus transvaalensis]|uniref:DUF4097 family beta strand repeat-containing protein n=1 Tax=Alkaliphilus transvaalensis TaxID=114628 RepID=UPI00047A741C|nr:DUF4097 family beta strand repeat-containing protein [Alkaliphilus transvaalensis]